MSLFGKAASGLGGLSSTVLTRYKADVSDHKRKLKELTGEQKKHQKEVIKGLELQNANIDKQIARYAKLAAGIAAVGGAYMAIKKGMQDFQRNAQLTAAAGDINIKRLRDASHGLLNEWQLLELASAGVNGSFKMNQQQLESVANWITVLRNKGNDLNEVFGVMKKAVAEAGVEELQKFGVQIRNVKGQLVQKGTEQGLNGLIAEANKNLGQFAHLAGDEAITASNKFDNATKNMSVALGRLGNALTPAINKFAQLVDYASRFVSGFSYGWGEGGSLAMTAAEGTGETQIAAKIKLVRQKIDRIQMNLPGQEFSWGQGAATNAGRLQELQAELARLHEERRQFYVRRGQQSPEYQAWLQGGLQYLPGGSAWATAGGAGAGGGGARPGMGPLGGGYGYTPAASAGMLFPQALGVPAGGMAPQFGQGLSYAPQGRMYQGVTPGTHAHRMAEMQDIMGSQGVEAFQMFQQASTAAFQAYISGSATMAQAFRQAMGSMIAAKASHMFATALEYGVLAIIDWNPGYLAGAAKAAAAGVALTAMAKALGYGGNVPGAGASAGGGAARVNTSTGLSTNKTRNAVIVLSPDWAENRHSAQSRLSQAIAQTERMNGSGSTVEYN